MSGMTHTLTAHRYRIRTQDLQSLLLTQGRRKDWLAAQCGVHPSMLSHLLAGRRTATAEVAERMAAALQVPVFLVCDVSSDEHCVSDGTTEDAA